MFLLDMDMNNDNTTQLLLLTGGPYLVHPHSFPHFCEDPGSDISICFVSQVQNKFLSYSCENIYALDSRYLSSRRPASGGGVIHPSRVPYITY